MSLFKLLFMKITCQHYIAVIKLLQRVQVPGPRQALLGANG
jgi:hypothetical protein